MVSMNNSIFWAVVQQFSGRMMINLYKTTRRFEIFTAVTMKNAVFWDVTPCGSYKN
jgi:hypothetical protein